LFFKPSTLKGKDEHSTTLLYPFHRLMRISEPYA
jgi:hypothetical protein